MTDVRPLVDGDIRRAAQLHREVLHMEFLPRFGPAFMETYYRAWSSTAGSIALVATSEENDLLGVLLGATNPPVHFKAMVRHDGLRIGTRMIAYAMVHPPLAKELVVTRSRRYMRGVLRLVRTRFDGEKHAAAHDVGPVVGEITHVLVNPSVQRGGIGRALIDAAVDVAKNAGVRELMLVTPPELDAKHFYEQLGWRAEGSMESQSGERFLRYRLVIP